MADNHDLLDSVGGSLLNDLLSDLNAAPAPGANPNDDSDDLFALLEQELSATYGEPAPTPADSLPPPPGMRLGSAAAFVVHQQPQQPPAGAPAADAGGDAWSQSLSQFGSLSIASDFLAADTAAKQQDPAAEATKEKAPSSGGILGKLFEADEEYSVDEKVVFEGQLGKKTAEKKGEKPKAAKAPEAAKVNEVAPAAPTQAPPPPAMAGPPMEMPPPMAGPPMGMHPMMPPMGMPPPMGMMPPPMGMVPPQMMGMPPQGMPPMGMPPHAMVPPPPPGAGGVPPMPAQPAKGGKSEVLNKRDFPALGADAVEPEEEEEAEERDEKEAEPAVTAPPVAVPEVRSYFNNANPNAPPVDAKRVETNLMPSRDLCYIVNSMVRPLQSLDAYSDDYYHWSVVNRSSQRRAQIGAAPFYVANPNPVDKSVKALAQKREETFQTNVKSRAEAFATEKKSLGQMVKTNVKRPKALLTTPVLSKGEKDEAAPEATDSKYTAEQKSSRVSMWKARVCIDKGYTAFLALIELRRLLQSHSAAPQLASELMVDVKANVELMHASLGIKSKADPKGGRKVEIDQGRLASTLFLPKGRVFCARAIEEGILPPPERVQPSPRGRELHFSWPVPAAEGEDRLLFALTSLVQNPHPRIDPAILYQCLDALTSEVTEGKCDLAAVTQSQMRMKLLHAILSIGKAGCANLQLSEGWSAKEKVLMEALGKMQ